MYKPNLIIGKEWMTVCLIDSTMSRDTEVKHNVAAAVFLLDVDVVIIEVIKAVHLLEYT